MKSKTPLQELSRIIEARHRTWRRKKVAVARSYVVDLLAGSPRSVNQKIAEEAGELCRAIARQSKKAVVHEAADLMFHALVGMRFRGVTLRDLQRELRRRFGESGHAEKARRRRRKR